MIDEVQPRKRRVRYAGTHPRRFAERYKERDPERYAGEREKVLARGDTPAGTHRPVCLREMLEILRPRPGEVGLDATVGYGGHAEAILPCLLPGGRLYGIDTDPLELPRTEARLRRLGFSEDVLAIRRMNFAGLPRLLAEVGSPMDFILADLGVSSMQLDDPARGFSYKADGPLDLRFNPRHGQPAAAFLARLGEAELAQLLRENADEPHAEVIARALAGQPVATTGQLAELVRRALAEGGPGPQAIRASLQRMFQALRIAVNDEYGALDRFLMALPECLKPGGRVAILAFHSGEDRRVKQAFRNGQRAGWYARIAGGPIRPSGEERRANPRSGSAKLRWAVKAGAVG